MTRTTDRQFVSETLRQQTRPQLWRVDVYQDNYLRLVTNYDESLTIQYGNVGQIKEARYQHWDREPYRLVTDETITKRKRERVLHLLQATRGRDGKLYLLVNGVSVRKDSLAEDLALQGRLKPTHKVVAVLA